MDKHQFNKYTKTILSKLPYWFKMKKQPNESKGALFLDVVGMNLDDIDGFMTYAYEQTRIQDADIHMIDSAFKLVVPEKIMQSIDEYDILGDGRPLKRVNNISEFFYRPDKELRHAPLDPGDVFFLDEDDFTLYTRIAYAESEDFKAGKIVFSKGTEWLTLPTTYHAVWNFFDEFGMLLSCPRIDRESNSDYKLRILDVFKNPANSSRDGLMNGVSRELDLRRHKTWEQAGDFEIKDPMVVLNRITIDGLYIDDERILISNRNTIIIKDDGLPKPQEISYVAGVELHALGNRKDYALQRQLYQANGTATELLESYVQFIRSMVPIMWKQFSWDEGYWDTADEDMNGFGCLPNLADARIDGFSWYDPDNPSNVIKPKLADLIVHPPVVNMVYGDTDPDNTIEIEYSTLVSSITVYPAILEVGRGELIEIEAYGKNG